MTDDDGTLDAEFYESLTDQISLSGRSPHNRDAAPFDDPDIRRAMQLTIDRKSFLDIIAEGQGDINGAMQSPPAGLWGLPPEILVTLPGYGPNVAANRAKARKLMEKHGYGSVHRIAVKVATLNIAQ